MAISRVESLAKKLAADGELSRADGREVAKYALKDRKVSASERRALEKVATQYQDRFDVGGSRAIRELLQSPTDQLPPPIEVHGKDPFTPDNLKERFVELVGDAEQTIDAAFYQVLEPEIVGALADAAERGVKVRLVTDDHYFDAQDTQANVERRVKVKGEINDLYKDLKWVDLSRPDAQQKLQVIAERLEAVTGEVPKVDWLKDSRIPDLGPAREYLEAALAGQTPDNKALAGEQREISNELSDDKVQQKYRPAYERLLEAGVEIREDDDADLSHNKYMVLDDGVVWAGSYNLQGLASDRAPTQGLPMTADNAVVIKSRAMADAFQADFEQMMAGRFHGDKTPSELDGVPLEVEGVTVTPFFSPNEEVPAVLAEKLESALEAFRARKAAGEVLPPPTLRLAGFTFSHKGMERVVDAMIALHREGADVEVVIGHSTARAGYSAYHPLTEAGVPVEVSHSSTMMHNKFLSMESGDGDTGFVWTGSANFTGPAYEDNDESVLLIESAEMARAYERIFDDLRDNFEDRDSIRWA